MTGFLKNENFRKMYHPIFKKIGHLENCAKIFFLMKISEKVLTSL